MVYEGFIYGVLGIKKSASFWGVSNNLYTWVIVDHSDNYMFPFYSPRYYWCGQDDVIGFFTVSYMLLDKYMYFSPYT